MEHPRAVKYSYKGLRAKGTGCGRRKNNEDINVKRCGRFQVKGCAHGTAYGIPVDDSVRLHPVHHFQRTFHLKSRARELRPPRGIEFAAYFPSGVPAAFTGTSMPLRM